MLKIMILPCHSHFTLFIGTLHIYTLLVSLCHSSHLQVKPSKKVNYKSNFNFWIKVRQNFESLYFRIVGKQVCKLPTRFAFAFTMSFNLKTFTFCQISVRYQHLLLLCLIMLILSNVQKVNSLCFDAQWQGILLFKESNKLSHAKSTLILAA